MQAHRGSDSEPEQPAPPYPHNISLIHTSSGLPRNSNTTHPYFPDTQLVCSSAAPQRTLLAKLSSQQIRSSTPSGLSASRNIRVTLSRYLYASCRMTTMSRNAFPTLVAAARPPCACRLWLLRKSQGGGNVCCCCFLTLTDPLRIQPWSQDRRNQIKSNRESEMSMESRQKKDGQEVASKGHRRDKIENINKKHTDSRNKLEPTA